ncbi:MAG: LamG domain-containing protein, partial [Maioricimonas sp. JB049]
ALSSAGRVVRNAAATGSGRDGHIVGPVQQVSGRFGTASAGLDFERPGSRVRTRIDGEFQAFTFACWVRIDSLEHRYNALFMGDGYENGEPHWQIQDDGRLMFSVMVDDSQQVRYFSELEQRVVTGAGLHRVYYSEPFWDITRSGQWFHLAAVYDPEARQVTQYVNGTQVSRHEIEDRFHASKLRIGPAEIGNWGQPFRKTPEFAVRNLNGTIDELAIFGAALDADEVASLYNDGRPLGY